jgi:hypothetical protein
VIIAFRDEVECIWRGGRYPGQLRAGARIRD